MLTRFLYLPIYFDPTTDFGFKKLFGEEAHKDLLMDFLNTLLPPHHQIASFIFLKPEQLPDHQEDRKAIFDILCESETGEQFIIEMQKAFMTNMTDRALYYASFKIEKQGVKGPWDFKLSPIYFIGILDFSYDNNEKRWGKRKLLRSFALRDDDGILMRRLHLRPPHERRPLHHPHPGLVQHSWARLNAKLPWPPPKSDDDSLIVCATDDCRNNFQARTGRAGCCRAAPAYAKGPISEFAMVSSAK